MFFIANIISIIGDRKNIHQIVDEFTQMYGKKPQLERRGSLEDLYNTMQEIHNKDQSNMYSYVALYVYPLSRVHVR